MDGAQVTVRAQRPQDLAGIRALHLAAFGGHGAVVVRLVDDLLAAGGDGAVSLVADDGTGQAVGHVLFTRALLDAPRRLVDVQVLSPLGVLPERQRQGVGAALVRAGLQAQAERGVPVVFLEGDPAYYARLGFTAGAAQGFRRPSLRIPAGAFQAVRLPAHEPWMTGTLVYPDVWWRHDAVGLRDEDGSGPA
jgi:putative acetyltransferase